MANIINGKVISEKILNSLKEKVEQLNFVPGLAVIVVGNDPASAVYVRNKERACKKVGIKATTYKLPEEISQEEIINLIHKLNNEEITHSILVQLPLPKHLNEREILNEISPEKDADGFHLLNAGKLLEGEQTILPCTPAGCIELLKSTNIQLEGKNAVVIGRSNIVGKPLALLLLKENCTVTLCHSKTNNLKDFTSRADIIICAAGKAKMLTADMVKENSIIIDVGINRDQDGKLVGDVDFENVAKKAKYITPVPGGVGPMTIAMLMKNVVSSAV